MSQIKAIIYTDGSSKIGLGHIYRMMAFAEHLVAEGVAILFVIRTRNVEIRGKIISAGYRTKVLPGKEGFGREAILLADIIEDYGAHWLIVDKLNICDKFLQKLKKRTGVRILQVDDEGGDFRTADIILNQNITASSRLYPCSSSRMLLGPKYVLMRHEFLQTVKTMRRNQESRNRLLIIFGGADPVNLTLKTLKALKGGLNGVVVDVVTGLAYRHKNELRCLIPRLDYPVIWHHDVSPIAPLICGTNLAISSAGTTSLELTYLGIPSMLIILARNQTANAEGLASAGVAENLGWWCDVSNVRLVEHLKRLIGNKRLLRQMSRKTSLLIDGKGADRVFRVIREITDQSIPKHNLHPNGSCVLTKR